MAMRSRAVALLCLCGAFPIDASASAEDALRASQRALQQAETKQEQLQKQQTELEAALAILQQKLVRASKKLQRSEADVAAAEAHLIRLEQEHEAQEQALRGKRNKMDGLARIAIRLSRTPAQAMVLMPTDGKSRLQAAHALSLITEELKTQAAAIAEDMARLQALSEEVATEKQRLEEERQQQAAEKKALEATLRERKKIRDTLAASSIQEARKIAALAKKTATLQELIQALNDASTREDARTDRHVFSEEGVTGTRGSMRAFAAAKGRIRIPVSGRVRSSFGQREGADRSKGVRIATRKQALVVAPFDAEVAYSGNFLTYGRMVILKHRGDYHTLLAGMARLDAKTGDFLLEGEPIGAMGGDAAPELYVEIREHNQPVDPASWMHGL